MKKLLPCTALVMCAGMACAQAEEKNDYGLPNLPASSFSRSACSFSNLALSNASACFLLRYSKSITVSVKS